MTNEEMMDRQANDRYQSDRAFVKLVSVLRPLIEAKLKSKYSDGWEKHVHCIGSEQANLNDPLSLLWTLIKNWPLFSSSFPNIAKGQTTGRDLVWDLKELWGLKDYRNDSTHYNPDFKTSDKDKAIDDMIKLLESIVPSTSDITKAISRIIEIKKESLLKEIEVLDNRILSTDPKLVEIDVVELDKVPRLEVKANADDEQPSTSQKAQIEDQHPDQSSYINEKLKKGKEKLEDMVSGPGVPLPITLPSKDKLRVVIEPPNEKSKKFMLQMYDTDGVYIGSYETSSSEEQALKKEPEIYRAQAELLSAFQKNGKQPIVAEWNDENKEKRIKAKRGSTGIVLGTIPERHWWTKNKP